MENLSYSELQACFLRNDLNYVCKENIFIITYVRNNNCELVLIYPSTISYLIRYVNKGC